MQYGYTSCCGKEVVRTCRLAEYEQDPSYRCPECGAPVERVLSAPSMLHGTREFQSFKSPVDGSIITCERSLREHNARNNVVNVHDGYDEKAVQAMTKKNYQAPIDAERSKDLGADLRESIKKLNDGYTPTPAHEGEEL